MRGLFTHASALISKYLGRSEPAGYPILLVSYTPMLRTSDRELEMDNGLGIHYKNIYKACVSFVLFYDCPCK